MILELNSTMLTLLEFYVDCIHYSFVLFGEDIIKESKSKK